MLLLVSVKKTLHRRKRALEKIGLWGTELGAGEQFLPPDSMARARIEVVFCSQKSVLLIVLLKLFILATLMLPLLPMYMYIYIYIYRERERYNIYIYIYIYIYTERERESVLISTSLCITIVLPLYYQGIPTSCGRGRTTSWASSSSSEYYYYY